MPFRIPSTSILCRAPNVESTAAMRKAAEFWADTRRQGTPTADEKAIDADVILAANPSARKTHAGSSRHRPVP